MEKFTKVDVFSTGVLAFSRDVEKPSNVEETEVQLDNGKFVRLTFFLTKEQTKRLGELLVR
jgi:hypothetical protein